ncbi:MAG: hypothetical protein HRT57_03080 [Crocinitomicaceae bacterium]|nr:hypothetical protein [Crocinitomicaceae bacterium]
MGIKEIEIFHNELEKSILPYFSEHGFKIDSKVIDEGIGSYSLMLKKKDLKIITISFCMHHLDLFDGIKIKLADNHSEQFLNQHKEDPEDVYSQLKPIDSIKEIKKDLIKHFSDFIKN